ncbi:Cytochrome bd-II ubiquinol oxidase subunit 2 [Aquisphaera giovannonii]|uniref:Cytochrome bd-II ubiquinol oxidase subunit 2 n=1 Tax=Aquisphaera giovannonii TaxID=406548 RepID=A0A5B9VUZ3_9BACT|nr:cytochrome d ubiquinol oxidase subunit II [Aquisphaera giovannonii]QEH31904.1 Cytochrome bd-II ubiquinol oxidase subunit 2 [Aquisphaera giovannonii]
MSWLSSVQAVSPAEVLAIVMLLGLVAYALLGGADYGAGVWDLLARGPRAEAQREVIAHAIGPVWEANHVWLIIVVTLLFSAFPLAFSAIMTTLHVPLSLMLIGVVLRGSAFTFRSYDNTEVGKHRWNRLFSIPSVVTPVLLGIVVGAIATGEPGRAAADALESGRAVPLFATWLRPFPIVVGVFTLNIFAFLAAVYLTLETDDRGLREDFRRRALAAAVALGAVAWVVYLLARAEAPIVFRGLDASPWGTPVRMATGGFAVATIAALWSRHYHVARVSAMVQVALILWGCALAEYPYILPPNLTIAEAASPPIVQKVLLVALSAGSVVLLPSILYMFRVFKGHTFYLARVRASREAEERGG